MWACIWDQNKQSHLTITHALSSIIFCRVDIFTRVLLLWASSYGLFNLFIGLYMFQIVYWAYCGPFQNGPNPRDLCCAVLCRTYYSNRILFYECSEVDDVLRPIKSLVSGNNHIESCHFFNKPWQFGLKILKIFLTFYICIEFSTNGLCVYQVLVFFNTSVYMFIYIAGMNRQRLEEVMDNNMDTMILINIQSRSERSSWKYRFKELFYFILFLMLATIRWQLQQVV